MSQDSSQPQHNIQTLSEFLLHAGTNFQLFDLGRGVYPMDTQTFLDVENGLLPCPRPRQQHAWFGIVFWSGKPVTHHYIWFVKFPVDERGLLVVASRNHFLQIIVDAIGLSLSDEKQETLPDNPYSFVPPQSQMAQFSAMSKALLDLPVSDVTEKVALYSKAPAISDWRDLSVQAVADFALRLHEDSPAIEVKENLHLFHHDFSKTLFEACESVQLSPVLKQACVAACIEHFSEQPALSLAALRAIATEQQDDIVTNLLDTLLKDYALDINFLSVIAGRHYANLSEHHLLHFFTQAARLDDELNMAGKLFGGFFADLVQLPALRNKVLSILRSPDRSDALAKAFGRLFSQTQGH